MKNISKLFSLGLLLCASTVTFGQKINAAAGLNFSSIMQSADASAGIMPDPKIKTGFHVGATVDYPLTDLISVDAGLLFSSMGYKVDQTVTVVDFKGTISTYYLTIPILAKANFEVADIQTFVGVGPYIGVGLFGNSETETTSFFGTQKSDDKIEWGNEKDEDQLKRLDFGLQAKAGVEFDKISVAFFYGLGLINIATENSGNGDLTAKNTVFGLTVGYTLFEL
ncbi:porin family protein [Owenweeksia hongkongensis]|uniref:porin family protein n=1 Tax=Owenweeksia hongkongensis TaxID=253245 RepID=UPI003A9059CF